MTMPKATRRHPACFKSPRRRPVTSPISSRKSVSTPRKGSLKSGATFSAPCLPAEQADGHAAHEQDDRFAGQQFVKDFFHVPAAGRDGRFADQENGEDDGRNFHDCEKRGDIGLVGDLGKLQEGEGLAEGDGGNGAVVRGQGGGVDRVEAAEFGHQKVAPDGDSQTEEEGRGEWFPELGESHPVEVGPALQPDGEEQVDGHRRVNLRRDLQVAFHQAGDHAQNEGEDHRGEQTHHQGIEDVHGSVRCCAGFLFLVV